MQGVREERFILGSGEGGLWKQERTGIASKDKAKVETGGCHPPLGQWEAFLPAPGCEAASSLEDSFWKLLLQERKEEFFLTNPPFCVTGSPYYDNVRPLSYPDSDAVIICFDISRPETLDSVLKKWKGEIQEFCPNTKMLLVGCKSDLRTDLTTLVELSNHRQTPVSYDQGSAMAKQISAPYIECSAVQSENSVRDIFHVATLACVNKNNKNIKRNKSARSTKRISHMPSRPDLAAVATDLRKDKAKSCTVM
ncbi:rho-related GTP-binding protein RhoE-like [Sinocyclocheilus anshuiensis]|nr:PREDICTED: rho-related GTP-binding protein RhoE-like [Sinocyclocheilus anshuiensis]